MSARGIAGWSWTQLATAVGIGVGLGMIALMPSGVAGDALAYYNASPSPDYSGISGYGHNFLYSPIASQLIEPLRLLPFDAFAFLVRLVGVACLAYVAREFTLPILLFLPVLVKNPVVMELWYGNVNLVLAAVAVAGLRRPGLWAVGVLTKITPGVGLVWFLVRREWSKLALAVGLTTALVVVSFVIAPGAWFSWIGTLTSNIPLPPGTYYTIAPLPVRLAVAALLIAIGARRSWPWTVVVGTWFAIPVLWPQTLAVLAPIPRLALQALAGRRARQPKVAGPPAMAVEGTSEPSSG